MAVRNDVHPISLLFLPLRPIGKMGNGVDEPTPTLVWTRPVLLLPTYPHQKNTEKTPLFLHDAGN